MTIYQYKDEIEAEMGTKLYWNRLDHKKASMICTYIQGLDFGAQDNYPRLMNEAIDLVIKMRDVFKKYVQAEL